MSSSPIPGSDKHDLVILPAHPETVSQNPEVLENHEDMNAPIVVLTYFSVPKSVNIHGLRDAIPSASVEDSSHEIDGDMKELREWLGAMCDLVYSEGWVASLWGRLSDAGLQDGDEQLDEERVLLATCKFRIIFKICSFLTILFGYILANTSSVTLLFSLFLN